METMQLPEDFSDFLRLLDAHEVEYLLAGGYAFGFDDPEVVPETFLDPERLVRLGAPPMRLAILTSVTGLTFPDSYQRAERMRLDGVLVTVISLADLRRNKPAAGRAKDLADLEELPEG